MRRQEKLIGTLRAERGREAFRTGNQFIVGEVGTRTTKITFTINADGSATLRVLRGDVIQFTYELPPEMVCYTVPAMSEQGGK